MLKDKNPMKSIPVVKGKHILEVQNMSVTFVMPHSDNIIAVKDLHFSLNKGEMMGIVGESGSGKSVSMLALMGLLPHNAKLKSEYILYKGKNIHNISENSMQMIRGKEIAYIPQEPSRSYDPLYTIRATFNETLRAHDPHISKQEVETIAVKVLEDVGIENAKNRLDSFFHQFSGGMVQRVMIALSICTNPSIIIADEPTTALDSIVQKRVMDILDELKDKYNLSIIFITHDIMLASERVNTLLIMRNGSVVESGKAEAVLNNPKHQYTKLLVDSLITIKEFSHKEKKTHGSPILSTEGIYKKYFLHGGFFNKKDSTVQALNDIHLNIYEGECFGMVGVSGSGKSTLARMLLADEKPSSGIIKYRDNHNTEYMLGSCTKHDLKKYRDEVKIIFQDPSRSLNPRVKIENQFMYSLWYSSQYKNLASKQKRNRIYEESVNMLRKVGLSEDSMNRYPSYFSGGQRQRIAIARALIHAPRILVCDEITSSLDVSTHRELTDLLTQLKNEFSLTLIFITHDIALIFYLCDRVAVMENGHIVECDSVGKIQNNPQAKTTQDLLKAFPEFLKDKE